MPSKKKPVLSKPHKMIDTTTEDIVPSAHAEPIRFSQKIIGGLIVLLLIVTVLLFKQGYIVAAIINGTPIFRFQLTGVLLNRYGKQVLDRMINETLVAEEARKAGINVSAAEVDAKTVEITGKFGGVSLDDLLKYQGMTKEDFQKEIRLQMTIEKLLGKDIQITDNDIDNFIATNRAVLAATEAGALKDEARRTILSQKISEKFQTWFSELRQNARITHFINL